MAKSSSHWRRESSRKVKKEPTTVGENPVFERNSHYLSRITKEAQEKEYNILNSCGPASTPPNSYPKVIYAHWNKKEEE